MLEVPDVPEAHQVDLVTITNFPLQTRPAISKGICFDSTSDFSLLMDASHYSRLFGLYIDGFEVIWYKTFLYWVSSILRISAAAYKVKKTPTQTQTLIIYSQLGLSSDKIQPVRTGILRFLCMAVVKL